jgi:hypothetical protein
LFGGGYYKTSLQFNLQTSIYKSDDPNGYKGRYHWIKPGEINWIRKLEVGTDSVQILIERDQRGIFYDRGTKFQEMNLFFDPSSGRIQKVFLRNGDSLAMKIFWSQQEVLLGPQLNCFSGVCFAGEEYLEVNEIDHRDKE